METGVFDLVLVDIGTSVQYFNLTVCVGGGGGGRWWEGVAIESVSVCDEDSML